jgi:transcriptional regulator with XRE-family HTH domain
VNNSVFGKELRRLRREAGLTLVDLATAASCSVVYVSQVERGDKPPPSPQHIKAMLTRIGCPEKVLSMTILAAQSRRAVEIGLRNKSPQEADMLIALARKSEAGEITDEVVKKILGLLDHHKD